VVALAVALVVPLGAGVATAQSFEGAAGTIVVEEGETSDGIDGAAGTILVRGTVTGDVSGAAGTVHVAESGRVEGSVSAAAGTVRIEGTVDGDVQVGGGTVEIAETARISGDIDVGASFLLVDGTVDGDVRAGAERIALGPNAEVGGEFRYDAEEFDRAPGASVAGGVVEDPSLTAQFGPVSDLLAVPSWAWTLYFALASLLLGAILLAVFPRFSDGLAARVGDEPATAGGVGILTLIGVPVALGLLAVTIVGIPLMVVGLFGYLAVIWVAVVYGQFAVGALALRAAGLESRWLALVVGVLAFAVLGEIPYVGGLFDLAALLLGLGALVVGLRDAHRSRG